MADRSPAGLHPPGPLLQGPLDVVELRRKTETGTLGPQTPVWRHGMEVWRPAANVPTLAGLFPAAAV